MTSVPGKAGNANPAVDAIATRHRWHLWEAAPWVIALVIYAAFPTYHGLGTEVIFTILFALSLDLALGFAGIVTLGHAAFFGAGAYTVAILARQLGWNEPVSGLLLAGTVAGAIGFLSGIVLLRTRGLTLLMLTLCTMALLEEAANMAYAYTGGFDGIPALDFRPVLGLFEFDPLYSDVQYLYCLGVLLVCFVLVRTVIYSPYGQSLAGIRENALRMSAVGAPVALRLTSCYALSAALAGISGALFVQANGFVNLTALSLDRAATILVILIIGGVGRLYGAFIGAIVYVGLSSFLAKVYPAAWQLGVGITLILVSLFARQGIIGLADTVALKVQRMRKR
jgi:branched-chain amino acid transport system permease protein